MRNVKEGGVCRQEGSFQLSEGWKAFAQCWDLGHGEQLQLSRRFVSNGCVWLNVTLVRDSPIAKQAVPGEHCYEYEHTCWQAKLVDKPKGC